MIDGTPSEDGRWIWFGGAWCHLSEDGRFWWDGQQWRPRLQASAPQRGAGAWSLIVIGALLLAFGLLRAFAEGLGGIVSGNLAFAMGKATATAVILIVPGILLLRRGWIGRWF